MLDGAAHRRLKGCGLAAAQPQLAPQLAKCAAAALMRAVQLDHRVAVSTIRCGRQHQRPGSRRADHREPGDDESAFGQRADRALQRHLERGSAADQDHQRADEPSHRQAQQCAGRHDGADDEVDRHERQQQRPPPVSPARGQPRARHGEHRGEHPDPARVVEELRQHRGQPVGEVEVPLGHSDALARDRQREDGDERGRRVGAEQFPLPGKDQPDQNHERQRQDRQAVHQVHHIGLGGGEHPDDAGDGFLQLVPPGAGDQRTGDHDPQERPG